MTDTPHSLRAPLKPVESLSRWLFLILLISGVAYTGCNSSKSTPSGSTDGESGSGTDRAPAIVSLGSCIAELQPDEFGINVPVDLPLSGLNEWADADLADRLNPLVDEQVLREDLSELLQDELVDRILRRRFVTRDATHARDSIWAQQAVSGLRTADKTLPGRVFDLFYYTMHTVQLAPQTTGDLPLSPFESAFFGRGSSNDRAWIFATLLHQLRIPSAIIRLPESEKTTSSDDMTGNDPHVRLIAVLLDSQLHLFDVALGIPLPPLEEDGDTKTAALPRSAATLSQAISNDAVFRQLDSATQQYPVTAEALQQASLEIIGDTTLWSRRMEGLSEALTGDQSVTLYRPLVSAGDQDGSLDIIRDSAGSIIPPDRIKAWPWPETRREARATMTAAQERELRDLKNVFQTPFPITQIGPELVVVREESHVPKLSVGTGWRYLLKARTDQLQSRTSDAIALYTRIQGFRVLPPTADESITQSLPPELAAEFGSSNIAIKTQLSLGLPDQVRVAQAQAGHAAEFWKASCLFEKRDWKSAAGELERYIRNQNSPRFTDAARLLIAISLANDDQRRRATAFLKTIPSSAPEHATAEYLSRRWSELPDAD